MNSDFKHSNHTLIENILNIKLTPIYLEVLDESYMHHSGPRAGTHYKVIIVSNKFVDKKMIECHRLVNKFLEPAFDSGVHALSLKTFSPEAWANNPVVFDSPKCAGKNTSLVGNPE